ncbi:UvrB/uvrC motif protein [Clostridium tepidiprofundi DSM 19306]|uniref:UvrB/uvrC motif protein n=1 Tax=Clostridium tepidiprofundi DSM 19306 TaxID=1121338 RepID=A0A151B5X5_9CLOT|nr:UvrB/UvrC motif-containing protein [Clostridium tepidiprofundi]KYH35160.1 UvrB/uvrC motif protein [Clostridium tepidiprofundi DSM 19306]
MICDRCHKNEANVHITKIVNGVKQELNLCEKCAKEIEGINMIGDIEFDTPFSLQNIINGIMDYVNYNKSSKDVNNYELVCRNCNTSYREFKKNGLLGCSECYKNFNEALIPVIKRVQGSIEHTGKVPKNSAKDIYNKRKIIKLKQELQKAIALEEYEKAAEIRDEIKELKSE